MNDVEKYAKNFAEKSWKKYGKVTTITTKLLIKEEKKWN